MSDEQRENSNRLVLWGAIAGLATCAVYPLVVFNPLPDHARIVLAALMGPLLGGASWGLRRFITLHRRSVAAALPTFTTRPTISWPGTQG